MVHERIMELLTSVQQRVFSTLTPGKIIELFKLGEGKPPKIGTRTSEILDGFYAFLGFTRLTTSAVIRKAIARGVQEGAFGYIAGAVPEIDADGRFQVPLAKVRFAVAEDEIDLESGFIMMPQAIPERAPVPAPGTPGVSPTGGGPAPTGSVPSGVPASGVMPVPAPGSATQKVESPPRATRGQASILLEGR